MSLNARMTQGDNRLYNVNRDVAHNFEYVIKEVADCLERRKWPALTRLAETHGLTDTDLAQACRALCLFIAVQADHQQESMAQCLGRCGFLACNEMTRVVLMAYLGNIVLGMHFAGVREATLNGVGPALTYKKLRWHGKSLVLMMSMPYWRRTLYKLRARCRRAWRSFWERNKYDG